MVDRHLRKRIERLEAAAGLVGDLENRLRKLAAGLHVDPEVMLRATQGHGPELAHSLDADGRITWEGFQLVYALLKTMEGR